MDIKIRLTRSSNLSHYGKKSGEVVTLDLENEYLPCVVSSEVYESESRTPMHAKMAQAIAARTYVSAHMNAGNIMDDTANYQAFEWKSLDKIPNSVKACQETLGQVLMCDGSLITAWYSNSNGGHTRRSDEAWSTYKKWTVSKPDAWDESARKKWGEVKASHGVGMSQLGASYAAFIGEPYTTILRFYYPNTTIQPNYGISYVEPDVPIIVPDEPTYSTVVSMPAMGVQILTKNDCYSKGRAIVPKGIVVHSTGANNPYLKRYVGPNDGILGTNQNNNHWNTPNFDKCGNGMIGKVESGEVMIYQTLPWNWRPWLVGRGVNGTYNDTHIQFEICEDGLTNESYWNECRAKAVHLCAWLCQEYDIDVKNVVGHYEAANSGYGSNHADPQHWMKKFGDSMNKFRADVSKMLGTSTKPEKFLPYVGTVQTNSSGFINARETPEPLGTIICKLYDGQQVVVIGEVPNSTFGEIHFPGIRAYIDTKYLTNIELA